MFAAIPGRDFNFTPGTKLNFIDVGSLKSRSFDPVMISIINDDIAEPCESFICTLEGGAADLIRGIEPNRITIEICDDDRKYSHACVKIYTMKPYERIANDWYIYTYVPVLILAFFL